MSTQPDSPWIVNTTRATFEQDVVQRSAAVPVVIDFWAPWCGPCRALGPILEKLTQEYGGRFVLVKANSDELPEAAAQFNVQGIPAVYAMIDGEVVDFFSGAVPESVVRPWLERVLQRGGLVEARRLESDSPGQAEQKYRELLAGSPADIDLKIGLARTLVAQERVEEARQIVAELEGQGYVEPQLQRLKATLDLWDMRGADVEQLRAEAARAPDNLEAQFQFANALAGAQQYAEALELLLTLVQRDRKNVGEKARQRMVDIFQALPQDSELTGQYRRKLSMALY